MLARSISLLILMTLGTFILSACSSEPAQTQTSTPATTQTASPTIAVSSDTASLLTTLSRGRHVIFLRHGHTDRSVQASLTGPSWWKSCDPAISRQLSDKGREQAKTIGKAFTERKIPVGSVYSSEYCRAVETARLAFGKTETIFELNWLTSDGDEPADLSPHRLVVKDLLSTQPVTGTNTVVVGHTFNLEGTSDVLIEEGEAAVFQPLGNGKFNLVGKVSAEQLAEYK